MCVHVIYKHTHAHSGEMVHPRPIVTATATHHKRLPIPIKARQIQIDKSVRMNHDSPPLECQGQIRTARHSELSLGPGTPNPYPRPCTLRPTPLVRHWKPRSGTRHLRRQVTHSHSTHTVTHWSLRPHRRPLHLLLSLWHYDDIQEIQTVVVVSR